MTTYRGYLYLIVALIIILVRIYQKKSKKEFKLNSKATNDHKTKGADIHGKSDSDSGAVLEGSIYAQALSLIEEMGYILVSKNISDTNDFEITFMNYEKKFFDFKRESTYITLTGNENTREITYTTWSDRYEFGQNSHNNTIAESFLNNLNEKI